MRDRIMRKMLFNKPIIIIISFLYLLFSFMDIELKRYGLKVGAIDGVFLLIEFFF